MKCYISCMKPKLFVRGKLISLLKVGEENFISLTDMAKGFGKADALISNWLRRKDTIEFLGVWEKIHNPKFKPIEFEGFLNQAEHIELPNKYLNPFLEDIALVEIDTPDCL